MSVAVLDELLTALHFGTPDQHYPDDLIVENARSSVENYLETLHTVFVDPADQPPPALEIHSLRKAGISTVSDEEFADSPDTENDRRRQLLGLVESDFREWPNGDNE